MFCCPSKKKSGPVEAGIANGALVVSYTGADAPRVWRGNLAVARSAALELQEAPNAFRIVMKTAGSADEEIVTLRDKESALNAFQAITSALMRDERPAAPRKSGFFGRLFKLLLWLVFLFFLALAILTVLLRLYGLPSLSTQFQQRMNQEVQQRLGAQAPGFAAPAPVAAPAPGPRQGVPVPADELFR